jgi:fatty acid desaturase
LLAEIQGASLLRRRYAYYWTRITLLVTSFAAIWVAFAFIGNSWWQLVVAALLGFVVTQFGFLGHDGAHRQILATNHWNEWTARLTSGVFAGLSYGWWSHKHNKHHSRPNQEGMDPDIGPGVLAFTPAQAQSRAGAPEWFRRRQGYLFFPLVLLEGLNLHMESVRTLVRRKDLSHRRLELTIIGVRLAGYAALLFATLSVARAAAFIVVQMAVFGLLLGGSFAPAHKGMPLVPKDANIDFLRRQVLTSRNIRGSFITDIAMGNLNYQIEHHLFPSMPAPNLRKAQPIVQAFCREHQIPYLQTGLIESYGIVIRYLNAVGIGARDPFECTLVQQWR